MPQVTAELECLDELRKLVADDETSRQLLAILDDRFLLHFVRGKKLSSSKAFTTLKKYCDTRVKNEAFMSHVDPQNAPLFDRRMLGVLKRRDAEGRAIVYWRMDNWDSVGVEDVFVAGTLLTEEIWNEENVERNGFVIIVDHTHLETRHLTMWTPSALVKLVRLFAENYPLRYSDVFIVNASKLTKWAVKLFSLFLPHKIKSRLRVVTKEESGVLEERLKFADAELPPTARKGDVAGGEENVWDVDLEIRIHTTTNYARLFTEFDNLEENIRTPLEQTYIIRKQYLIINLSLVNSQSILCFLFVR